MSSPRSRSVSGPSSTSRPYLHVLALAGPRDRGVVDGVAVLGHHHEQAKRGLRPAEQLLLQVVAPALPCLLAAQRALARLGLEAVAHPALGCVRAGPAKRVNRVVGAGRIALGRFRPERGLDRRKRLGVRAEEGRHQLLRVAPGVREVEKVLGGAHEEAGQRQADDVGGGSARQIELDRQSATFAGVVGDPRVGSAVGQTGRHAHPIALHVHRGSQLRGARGGGEAARHQGALGVGRPVAGGSPRHLVDCVDHGLGEGVHRETVSDGRP